MKKNRAKLIVSMLLIFTLAASLLAGCNSKSKQTGSNSISGGLRKPGEPTVNKDKVLQLPGTWAKQPAYNGNYFNADGYDSTADYTYERLLVMMRVGSGKTYYQLAESIDSTDDKTTIKLRKNVKWHDGQPFTSKDIWAFYTLNNTVTITKYLTSIETPDDYTVVFNWQKPAVFKDMKMRLLAKDLSGTIPYHIYKQYVDKADSIIKAAKPAADKKKRKAFGIELTKEQQKEMDKNWNDFKNAGPAKPTGTGPFKFDSVDDNQLILVKNQDYYGAENVNFEKIRFVRDAADIAQSYAMLRNGEFDVSYGTPAKDIMESMLASNTDLIHYKMFDNASYGIFFNSSKAPFNDIKVRQAIAYIVDKKKVREVVNYYGKEFPQISAIGFPPTLMEKLIKPETKLTDFTKNEQKAAQLLIEAGWKKGSDGIWADKNGKKFEAVIAADSAWDTVLNNGQIVSEQLTKFGLPTKVKAVDSSVFWTNVDNGDYGMVSYLIDMYWSMNDPWDGLRNAFQSLRTMHGMPKDLKVPGRNGQMVDVNYELDRYIYTSDEKERMNIVNELAYIYNNNAYGVNLYQTSYGAFINMSNVDGNFPMAQDIEKYDRNMPQATKQEDIDRILEMNVGFQSNRFVVDGNYWPK